MATLMSRLPLPITEGEFPDPVGIHLLEVRDGPVKCEQVSEETQRDADLSQVIEFVNNGWPNDIPSHLKPFWQRSLELSTLQGCLLRGDQVVIPLPLRQKVLDAIHASHHGIVRTKAAAIHTAVHTSGGLG